MLINKALLAQMFLQESMFDIDKYCCIITTLYDKARASYQGRIDHDHLYLHDAKTICVNQFFDYPCLQAYGSVVGGISGFTCVYC